MNIYMNTITTKIHHAYMCDCIHVHIQVTVSRETQADCEFCCVVHALNEFHSFLLSSGIYNRIDDLTHRDPVPVPYTTFRSSQSFGELLHSILATQC